MSVNCNRHFSSDQESPKSVLPADWPYRAQSHFISVGKLSWHVQVHDARRGSGPGGSAPTLILLHGTGASTHSWADLIGPLTEFACVINLDLPGHGFTRGATPAMLTLPGMARALDALLRAMKISGEVVFVGHSAGAPLAIEWVLNHGMVSGTVPGTVPDTITTRHIIGLNPSLVPPPSLYTTLLGPVVAPIATSSPMTGMLTFIAANTGMVDQLLDSTGSKIPATHRERYKFLFSQNMHVQGAMGFMAGADLPSILERGKRLRVPMSFLVGRQDSWVKETPLKEVIASSFPKAKVITWEGGHLIHEERPRDVARLIQDIVLMA
jgi:magnesium chelatase accessory protein